MRERAGAWAVQMVKAGVERMVPAIHASDVVRLLAEVGTDPAHVHDADALARDRRDVAKRIIAWCPSPERLARWCVVAVGRYRAENVAGYLRCASERGDPGTLLAQAGQGERVLSRADEQALRVEHADDVARIVTGAVAVLGEHDDATRDRLRAELRALLARGRNDGARRVLLQLLGPDRSDVALARATDGICTIAAARRLIA